MNDLILMAGPLRIERGHPGQISPELVQALGEPEFDTGEDVR